MSKKALASRLLGACGLLSLPIPFPRDTLIVLNYHRVMPDGVRPNWSRGVVSADRSGFAEQVAWIARRFRTPAPAEAVETIEKGGRFGDPSVLITFDDGYIDNFEVAFPVLREHQVPAVFFIPTEPFLRRRLGWWDHTAYLVRACTRPSLRIDYPTPGTFDLSGPDREAAIKRVLKHVKAALSVDYGRFLDSLRAATGVASPPPEVEGRELMEWGHLKTMAAAGMAIGGHTHTHPLLAGLGEEEQRRELTICREILLDKVGGAIDTMAYPTGKPGVFTAATKKAAREAGYRTAFSFYGGTNRGGRVDPFDVRRIAVGPDLGRDGFRAVLRFPGIFGTG